jgi:hypothetical protein
MTLRKWITFASAAAMIAGVGACKDTGGGSATGTKATPEGRRGETLPRARDAGTDMSTGTGSTTSPSSPTTPSSTPSTTPGSTGTSGSSSDTKK